MAKATPAKAKAKPAPARDEDEAFPRGGGSSLEPIELKKLKRDALAEAEAELQGAKSKKKTLHKGTDEGESFIAALATTNRLPKFAELLKFKMLHVNSRLWGVIVEVSQRGLVVSLPHGLKGFVPAGDVGARTNQETDLLDIFSIGQLVAAQVTRLPGAEGDGFVPPAGEEAGKKQKKKIILSLAPAIINAGMDASSLVKGLSLPATVQSLEDHGAVLSFGIQGTTAFLPKKAMGPAPLKPGMIIDVVVKKVQDGSRAIVDATPEAVSDAMTQEWPGMTLDSLVPGMLVSATVRNVLSDGLVLSFLTFFSGTVDPYHLQEPGALKAKAYSEKQRVRARVLFVDPESKRVMLTLQKGLVARQLPANFPAMGQVFSDARVLRVDAGLGLLCTLPSGEGHLAYPPGFCHISNAAEGRVASLEKNFKIDQRVAARVTGFRPMDGLAVLTLNPTVVNQTVFSFADLHVGMPIKGTVAAVEDFGLIVNVTRSISALVPYAHASEVGTRKAARKFKVGQHVSGLVLECSQGDKKVVLTLKPSLLSSKLKPITSMEASVTDKAVFVSFFGKTKGMVPATECPLAPGQSLAEAYTVGQVVKTRVLGVDSKGRGLKLSLLSSKKAAGATEVTNDAAGGKAPAAALPAEGSLVWGRAKSVHGVGTDAPVLDTAYAMVELRWEESVESPGIRGCLARLDAAHLADHPSAAAALAEHLRPGQELGRLLILQAPSAEKEFPVFKATRKAALIAAAEAGELPSKVEAAAKGAVVTGYVASLTQDAAFVRFLGTFTGRAGLGGAPLAGGMPAAPLPQLSVGQTVRARITHVDAEAGRISVSLRVPDTGVQYLQGYFRDIATAAQWSSEPTDIDWQAELPIGSTVAGAVSEVKEYGVLCDVDAHPDIVGIAAPNQVKDGRMEAYRAESRVTAAVLDWNPADGVVDLSLLPRLSKTKGGRQQQQPVAQGQSLQCTVELTKLDEGYAVLSLPEHSEPRIGFLALAGFNEARATEDVVPGSNLDAVVAALPGPETSGRLLLIPTAKSRSKRSAAAATGGKDGRPGKAARLADLPPVGQVLSATVEVIHPTHADLLLETGHHTRLSVTEAEGAPDAALSTGKDDVSEVVNPLGRLTAGDTIKVVVTAHTRSGAEERSARAEVSARTDALTAAAAGTALPAHLGWRTLAVGQRLLGWVQEAGPGGVWCVFGPGIRGLAHAALAAATPEEVPCLMTRYPPGTAVAATVVGVSPADMQLDVTLTAARIPPVVGALVLAQIVAVDGRGVLCALGSRCTGRVPLVDIHDGLRADVLAGLEPKQWVLARVTGVEGGAGKDGGSGAPLCTLSLRPSSGGVCEAHGTACAPEPSDAPENGEESEPAPALLPRGATAEALTPGQVVAGYIRGTGKAGVFVTLARGLDARLRLGRLAADGSFVDRVPEGMTPGKLLVARVARIVDGRVELTRRTRHKSVPQTGDRLKDLELGQAVRAEVTRIEPFGVFLRLEDSGVVGLAHRSQLADRFVKSTAGLFTPGQKVIARVLGVDLEKGRLSLGLKPSYFEGELAIGAGDEDVSDEESPPSDFEDELAGSEEEEMPEDSNEDDSELDGESEGAEQGDEESMDLDDELAGDSDSK